ncbi:acyltransferase family protein [Brevibacillus composti]|uniref:Acyltransferase family protein n=1 Tax=Brevibacillus composti TaxID=2796470 RepID=A0A7T5EMJ2_9BACL|nr:acyltransferase family protein [Brevibacillus composti]QQE75276.1 acyltransferase family protein [Brevibacillus composti]QUO42303.1 acyltransferase family protein [Brevibacillus composti]
MSNLVRVKVEQSYPIKSEKKRVIYADILRVLATLAVINIHVTSSYSLASFTTTNLTDWWVENLFNSLSRWSVPIFFMVSGMLLLQTKKEETVGQFFRKRTQKVLVPFFIWGLIYGLVKTRYTGVPFDLTVFLKELVTGKIYLHFWFLYTIIALYIFTPIVKFFIAHAKKQLIMYALGIWFVSTCCIPLLERSLHVNFYISSKISFTEGYLGLFVLGYVLSRAEIGRKLRLVLYAAGISSLAAIPLLTYVLTAKNGGKLDGFFYNYLGLAVVLASTAIFIGSKSVNWEKRLENSKRLLPFLRTVSDVSFGIYLVHLIFLAELGRGFEIFQLQTPALLRVPLTNLAVFALSLITVLVLQRVPLLKKMVP